MDALAIPTNVPTYAELTALSQQVGTQFLTAKMTCATAESCTGGLVGHLLTEISGCSVYFMGGAIVYSNEIKAHVLGVDPQTLATDGAVSYATAAQMAQGAQRLYGVDVAVSITGIAGPGGGSPTKPVGLVHVHVVGRDGYSCGERFVWPADRSGNKLLSAQAALQMMSDYLTAHLAQQSG
ncbi:MAG: CinA family protein [Caldilineaceae bacterium]|nr:CinA family protein [Caldilineaceae bacterium]